MAIEMVADRNCYVPSQRKEFPAGAGFTAADEREAVRLERKRRATRVQPTAKPAHVDLPAPKAMKPVQEIEEAPLSETGLYQRRDMRAEDGRTGEVESPASSRRGRRPKVQTSEDSEE